MKSRLVLAGIALFVGVSGALAQEASIKGEIKRIDEAAGKISIKHGPIKKFDMDEDGMTMVFHVQDPAMLKQVKVGDKVLFDAENEAAGFTITKMEKSR